MTRPRGHDACDARIAQLEAELRSEKHHHRTDKQTLSEELAACATTESKLSIAVAALEEHATKLAEWDMLYVAPDGTMPGGHVADAHWARAHIDALLAALASISKEPT